MIMIVLLLSFCVKNNFFKCREVVEFSILYECNVNEVLEIVLLCFK